MMHKSNLPRTMITVAETPENDSVYYRFIPFTAVLIRSGYVRNAVSVRKSIKKCRKIFNSPIICITYEESIRVDRWYPLEDALFSFVYLFNRLPVPPLQQQQVTRRQEKKKREDRRQKTEDRRERIKKSEMCTYINVDTERKKRKERKGICIPYRS